MPNLNQVNLIGHLTRPVEVRYTPKGTAVAEIGLAVNRTWKDSAGTKREEATFIEVTAWARLAEVCAEYLTKGDAAFFSGRLTMDSWVDKQTQQKRSKLKVIADTMQILKARQTSDGADEPTTDEDSPTIPPDCPEENLIPHGYRDPGDD